MPKTSRNTRGFREWLAHYTDGGYSDYAALPAARQNELWEIYLVDREGPYGEPCGSGLIYIKAVTSTPDKE